MNTLHRLGSPRAVMVIASLAASACAPARASEARGPDGSPGWIEVTCRQRQEECAKKAREVCGGPYTVGKSDGRVYDGPGAAFYTGSMLVRCGTAPSVGK